MKYLRLTLLGLALLLGPGNAAAQLIVSAPIAERSSRRQISHQTTMSKLKSRARQLLDRGVKEQALTTKLVDQNLNLHREWYASLREVSATVRQYERVRRIFENQGRIIELYARNVSRLHQQPGLRPEQIQATQRAYAGLIEESVGILDDLQVVLQPGHAQMTDAQRLKYINRIDERMQHHLALVIYFTRRNTALAAEQARQAAERRKIHELYGASP
ncbi:hypothetical protein [Solirubrum puertoriconensis]|uniref:Conjugal transfer protein TraI n=1 Tax=Solirubrum puertoriconensis TaxID=1751427 RepID=A0A9X0L5X1_SOLP1|nr:hypothetical protein [Solirubrum puertoriconensis]KUG09066.1 hypothetical protein ASU33_19790 [Solirubrum puertoriconensis]